MGHVTFQT